MLQDDRDEPDELIEKNIGEFVEVDTESSEQQPNPVYDYQLDIDCNGLPITIDEFSMSVNHDTKLGLDAGI